MKFCAYFLTEWDAKQEDQTDVNVWEDNWDDDAIEDDFSVQLRSELENQGMKMESKTTKTWLIKSFESKFMCKYQKYRTKEFCYLHIELFLKIAATL